MKKTVSSILSAMLVMQSFLFAGCEKAEEAVPAAETECAVVSTLSTDAVASFEETVPETAAAEEPAKQFYAVAQGENGLVFPCLIENDEDKLYTLESLEVVYYAEEKPIETAAYSPKELKSFAWQTDAALALHPADALVQNVPCILEKDAFAWAELTFTLLDSQGQKAIRSFGFTVKEEAVNTSFMEDGALWEYARFEGGSYWAFFYSITNYSHKEISLEAVYSVNYVDGKPISTASILPERFAATHLTDVKSLKPGQSKDWSNGFGTDFGPGPDRMKVTFAYRDAEGALYPVVFRFILDEEKSASGYYMDHDTWILPQIQNNLWLFDMVLENGTQETLTLEALYWNNYQSGIPMGSGYSSGSQLEDISLGNTVLAPGQTFAWTSSHPASALYMNQRKFVFQFRDSQGNAHYQTFRYGMPEEIALAHTTDHLESYDPIIDFYEIPSELGAPQYTLGEIRQMIENGLTLDEVAEKISTVADLVQYLHQKNYGKNVHLADGNIHFWSQGQQWSVDRSAENVFHDNAGNCGGCSNLVNYILRGDYEEQGYVQEASNKGGHMYNYFKTNGVFYFFDLMQIASEGSFDNVKYRIFAAEDPQDFSRHYIAGNRELETPDTEHYLLLQYMYPCEGSHLPIGSNANVHSVLNYTLFGVLPREIEASVKLLFVEDGTYAPIFAEAPAKDRWPAEAQ